MSSRVIRDAKLYHKETHLRSIAKGLGWRFLATLTTFLLVLMFTRRVRLSLEVGGLEVIAKLLLYYSYERVWNLVDWGRGTLKSDGTVLWSGGR